VTNAAGCDAITAANAAMTMNAGHGSAGATVGGISAISSGCIADAIAIATAIVATTSAGFAAA
jgi:hypothetical protein